MQQALRELTIAVHALTIEAGAHTTNLRAIVAHTGSPLPTVQGRVKRARSLGLIDYEPELSNTIRLGPNITVHNGEVYRLQTL